MLTRLARARVIAAGLGLLAAALTPADDAIACTCSVVGLQRHAVPDDGATGFPTDGVLRVFLTAFPAPLRALVAREYRLVDDAGAEVPIDATVVWTRIDLRPRQPLRPNARYTLEALYTYAYGERLSDSDRLERANQRDGLVPLGRR